MVRDCSSSGWGGIFAFCKNPIRMPCRRGGMSNHSLLNPRLSTPEISNPSDTYYSIFLLVSRWLWRLLRSSLAPPPPPPPPIQLHLPRTSPTDQPAAPRSVPSMLLLLLLPLGRECGSGAASRRPRCRGVGVQHDGRVDGLSSLEEGSAWSQVQGLRRPNGEAVGSGERGCGYGGKKEKERKERERGVKRGGAGRGGEKG